MFPPEGQFGNHTSVLAEGEGFEPPIESPL